MYVSGESPPFETRPAERAMTIRDLLSHQAGLTYGFTSEHPLDRAFGTPPPMRTEQESLAEWSASVAKIPLYFSPGSAWRYSVATDLCGYLTEVISGKPFEEYLQERIFSPLGMIDTSFYVPDEKLERFATCYEPDENGGFRLQDDPETSGYRRAPAVPSGGGGLVSTAGDYMRFCQALLNGGSLDGVRLLGRKTLELMTLNHLAGGSSILERNFTDGFETSFADETFAAFGFGLGFSVLTDLTSSQVSGSIGTYAWGGAASTEFWIDPVEELIVVFMTQLLFGELPIRGGLQAMVYAALED